MIGISVSDKPDCRLVIDRRRHARCCSYRQHIYTSHSKMNGTYQSSSHIQLESHAYTKKAQKILEQAAQDGTFDTTDPYALPPTSLHPHTLTLTAEKPGPKPSSTS